jgi:hypothetical protein
MSAFDAHDQEPLLGLAGLDADAAPGPDDARLEELLQRALRATADGDAGLLPAGISEDAPFGEDDGAGEPTGWPSAREDDELDMPGPPADADEPQLEDGPAADTIWDAGGDVDPTDVDPGGDEPWSVDP